MTDRQTGGRKFACEPGSSEYDRDEFRGQIRRPWMCFRVGAFTRELTSEAFMEFIEKTRLTMIDKGLLLDGEREHLKYLMVDIDYHLFCEELKDGLRLVNTKYEEGPMSRPIVIVLLDQVNNGDFKKIDEIIEAFREVMYFFKLEKDELLQMISLDEYDILEGSCKEFANYVHEIEQLPESVACRMPVEEPVLVFGAGYDDASDKILSLYQPLQRIRPAPMNRNHHRVPPGLPPPGLHGTNEEIPSRGGQRTKFANGQDNHPERYLQRIQQPPGISLPPPPGLDVYSKKSSRDTGFDYVVPPKGLDILMVEDVMAAKECMEDFGPLERGAPISKDNKNLMAISINGAKIKNRFRYPFSSAAENLYLLQVVNYSVSSRNKEAHHHCKELLLSAFSNTYPSKLKKQFLDYSFREGSWSEGGADLLFELVMLFFYTARYPKFVHRVDNFWSCWTDLCNSYDSMDLIGLQEVHVTYNELANIKKVMKQVGKWHHESVDEAALLTNHTSNYTHENPMNDSLVVHNEQYNYSRNHEFLEQDRYQPYHHPLEREENREYEYENHNRSNYFQGDRPSRSRNEHEDYGRDEVDHSRPRDDYGNRFSQDNHSYHPVVGFRRDGGAVNEEMNPSVSNYEKNWSPERDSNNYREQDENVPPVLPEHDTDAKVKQTYKYSEEDYEPLWKKSEREEPPEDFKTLPTVPVLSEYVNAKMPYLRRIQESGVYDSAAHYLDVQFRLLREDLVSPMRDGIDVYRKNGTCKGRFMDGQPSSDIAIFVIERVDGKQVTERDGLEMRVAWPQRSEIDRLMDADKEMKEMGLMMLSDDRFVNDFHLTIVNCSLLSKQGCLHLEILEETQPFKSDKCYQMAQANSYLPSYQHVLENMKKINPFKPIPFERYIVHGKKVIFRPLFHRHDKTAEQIEEEKKLEKVYGEIRSIASSKRYMAGKAVPKGADEDDDGDDYYMPRNRKSEEEKEDIEYDQLMEPIFRTLPGVSNGGNDQILIGKKWYRISRLLDDFHPDYLDESQRAAFCHTFRNELSLIQGPPGTGKTHIGVQIVKTMLQNRSHWRMTEPILIVCYTNSGLDNLLERVLQMIDDDEELSKDNGKPRMIRYGRKCESDVLKRQNVLRYDVHEQYKTTIPEKVRREQDKAGKTKRMKGKDLAAASYALYCSRSHLLSFDVLAPVMDKDHQLEVAQFALEHADTKGKVLCKDEAIACWLLDRDFGKATKQQIKKQNKSKFNNMPDDEDNLNLDYNRVEYDDNEADEELDDEAVLDKLFNKMNMDCTAKKVLEGLSPDDSSEYYTKGKWEIVHDNWSDVLLMGKGDKGGLPIDEQISKLVKEIEQMILASEPLPEKDLEDIKFIYSLARPKRWALYITWCRKLRHLIATNLPQHISAYRKACVEMQKVFTKVDAEFMKLPMVIGMTTSGCSRLRPMLELVKPRVLVVEEAAEVLEGHIISAMISSVEHVVMIGDHKQLRPNPAVHELGTEYGLQISMFERLVERGLPYCQLRQQHRMNTQIAELIVRHAFYSNVHDAQNVMSYPKVEGMDSNLFLWSHTEREETPDGTSWLNRHEASMTAALVKYLLKQSYTNKDIVVLSTYAAQRNYILREFSMVFGECNSGLVPVETVDSYQGRESKIVVLSLVRSHRGVPENTGVGFLAVSNRICVALTRAQHGLYVVGNGAYIMNNAALWNKINLNLQRNDLISYCLPLKCTAHGNQSQIKHPSEFSMKCPEGGCAALCNIKKDCGHVCERQCHPKFEYDHKLPCEYRCMLTCPNPKYNHECAKRCYEDCGSCMTLVEITLECGHNIATPCSRIKIARCDQKCSKILGCGHTCANMCAVDCTSVCQEFVTVDLKCGHKKQLPCCSISTGTADWNCVEVCGKQMLSCAHRCTEKCGRQCTVECRAEVSVTLKCGHHQKVICSNIAPDKSTDHIVCETHVPQTLEPCGHIGDIPCGTAPSTEKCSKPCKYFIEECEHTCGDDCGTCFKTGKHVCQQLCQKTLPCGHTCSRKCGEDCFPCKAFCSNTCEHQSCGNSGQTIYGRLCNQSCVMCYNLCGNKCIHRSCSKMCFEECNVNPCTERCSKMLSCKHACLGMCGEVCPKICGTCERKKYLDFVAPLDKSQAIHAFIMIPKCHDVFPLEVLDDHVMKLKEAKERLRCPKCKAVISGICRYAKYEKEFKLTSNLIKLEEEAEKYAYESYVVSIKKNLKEAEKKISQVAENQTIEIMCLISDFRAHLSHLTNSLSKIPKNQKYRLRFLLHLSKCYSAVALLLFSAKIYKMTSRKDIPPGVESLMNTLGGSPFMRMMMELKTINSHISTTVATEFLGVVMPKLRFSVAKLTIFAQISVLVFTLTKKGININDNDKSVVSRMCSKFLADNERMVLEANIEIVQEALLHVAPDMDKLPHFYTWKRLEIPLF